MTATLDDALDALVAGDLERCAAISSRSVAVAPNNARGWQMLGLASKAMQDSGGALAAFKRAAALDPNDAKIAAGVAMCAYEAGEASALLFHRACALSPADPELLLSTVAALKADGHPEVGEQLLERALAVNPGWVSGHEALASLRWTAGATADFARSFAEGCSRAPQSYDLWCAWARTLLQACAWDAASAVIAKGRAQFASHPGFDALEAYAATETGDDERAEALFDRAASLDDAGKQIAHVRHCIRTAQIERAESIALAVTKTSVATTAWPYLSLLWRVRGDPRAAWLDGDPPYVKVIDLPFEADGCARLAHHLRALHTTRHHPAEQSLRGGTQTEGELLLRTEPAFVSARRMILDAVAEYVAALPARDPGHPLLAPQRARLLFAGSWSVRLQAQGFHIVHTHPRGWISSALYVSLPDDMGTPPAGWLELGAPPPDLRLDLPPYLKIEPKPGRLVLFPSTMWHGTIPFDQGERITIAFDIATPA